MSTAKTIRAHALLPDGDGVHQWAVELVPLESVTVTRNGADVPASWARQTLWGSASRSIPTALTHALRAAITADELTDRAAPSVIADETTRPV